VAFLSSLKLRIEADRERGAILVLTALVMMLLLFIAAFATDLGAWYRQGQEQQRAADVSALNGIQAYDRGVKTYFESLSPAASTWTDLSVAQSIDAERDGMIEAINTVLGLLETGGKSFTQSPVEVQLSPPPNNPGDQSIYTITADDGTLITITREGNGMSVVLSSTGSQYFSNILREAPEIRRASTAVISNCNADCSRDIPLEPPFAGFAAAGQGDGWRPLIGDNDRVWLVNHLWDQGFNGGTGSVVCMDVKEQAICSDWAPLTRSLFGANRPADLIDNSRNKIFYPGINRSDSWTFQIGCVNTDVRSDCATTSIGGGWGGGPWMVDDDIWAVSADGLMYCIEPDNIGTGSPFCSGYSSGKQTAAYGVVGNGIYVAGDVIGSKIIMYHASYRVWHCWDTATDASCGPLQNGSTLSAGYDGSKFIRYNTSGQPQALCFAIESIGAGFSDFMTHECLNENNTLESNPVPNLYMRAPNDWGWSNGGQWTEGYTWNGERMYMSFWPSNRINCYDWTTQNTCSPIDAVAFDGGHIDFYTFDALNENCIVALGDVSKFYTFNPETGLVCTGSTVTTTIIPCSCDDGVNTRYGVLELPSEIGLVLNSASAVVNDLAGNELLVVPDLLAGSVDLSAIDSTLYPTVELIITVDSKVDANDIPLWTEPFNASLSLVVQPTLSE
jgi:hypothetical protein